MLVEGELDRYILRFIEEESQKSANTLPGRAYEQRLYQMLALIVHELLQRKSMPISPARAGLLELHKKKSWLHAHRNCATKMPEVNEEFLTATFNEIKSILEFLPDQHILKPLYFDLLKSTSNILKIQFGIDSDIKS